MEAKPKPSARVFKGLLLLPVSIVALFGLALLPVWDCTLCGNPPGPKALGYCLYCNSTGKWNTIQRIRVPAKAAQDPIQRR